MLWGDGERFLSIVDQASKLSDEVQLPFVFWGGVVPLVGVSDSRDVQVIAKMCPDKPFIYKFADNWLGNGLITAGELIHKHTSKKLTGLFTGSIVAGYQDTFNEQAQGFVQTLKTQAGTGWFDVVHHIDSMTLTTVYNTALAESLDSSTKEYLQAMRQMLQFILIRAVVPLFQFDSIYKLTPMYKRQRQTEDLMNHIVWKAINTKKKERELVKNRTETIQESETTFRSYLDLLLDLGESDPQLFTKKQITGEVNTIISAGFDTVANTLHMCLVLIGSYPDVQEKLYAEMQEIFGDSNRPVSKEDLSRMRYCEAVINETLRLYPPAPVVFRQAHADVQLRNCTIPAGTMCAINIWGAGRSRRAWGDDVEEFKPERWLQDDLDTSHFLSFSLGKRLCIGKRYAIALLKTTLAHCVRQLVVEADVSKLRLALYFLLTAVSGHHIKIRCRE